MELRKLIAKLRNEDKFSIGDISKTVGKAKSVIHNIFRKLETGSCEAKKPPCRPRKTTAREERYISNESKKDLFATATLSLKERMFTLALKIKAHIFPKT